VTSVVTLAQALGVAYATGLNLYATVAVLGLATRFGWVDGIPSSLGPLGSTWVIVLASVLYLIDFMATLMPGVASAWETIHSLVRPPAAAALAAATAWHGDPLFVLIAAMLGAGLGVTTHTTKLGLRYAIDASPEPITNAATNIAELGLIAALAIAVWKHPFISLLLALVVLGFLIVMVRLIWRTLRRVFTGHWMPARGLMQEPRASSQAITPPDE
jgi:uncharacterized protein DUF4126